MLQLEHLSPYLSQLFHVPLSLHAPSRAACRFVLYTCHRCVCSCCSIRLSRHSHFTVVPRYYNSTSTLHYRTSVHIECARLSSLSTASIGRTRRRRSISSEPPRALLVSAHSLACIRIRVCRVPLSRLCLPLPLAPLRSSPPAFLYSHVFSNSLPLVMREALHLSQALQYTST
jgi:hypothetical protein